MLSLIENERCSLVLNLPPYENCSMTKRIFSVVCFIALCLALATTRASVAQEKVELWPNLAPGETVREPNVEDPNVPNTPAQVVTTPQLLIFRPEKQTSDACVLVFPGGGFNVCFYHNEGIPVAKYWNEKGFVSAVLVYRVPRPKSGPIYMSAFQDAQRAVRYMKANADKYGINPDKIGVQGFSAGSCLTVHTAVNSTTQSYDPIDEMDDLPASVAFAIPVYPAYVLTDGATDANANKGEGASLIDDLHFDEQTPPMCLIHGDADIYSPLGSVEIYKKLRKMGISCELHVFAGAPHGFMFWDDLPNAQTWQDRCYAWLKKMGY